MEKSIVKRNIKPQKPKNRIKMEELIRKSEDLGFVSRLFNENELKGLKDVFYYLWLCELQKWIREEYGIYIIIQLVFTDGIRIDYYAETHTREREYDLRTEKTYEKALESGIKKGLELINP